MDLAERHLLIDGKLVEASGGRTFANINPATEEELGVAPDASADDMDRAIAAARRTFDETNWSTDVELRVRCLRQFDQALQKHSEDLRALTVAEVGCPVALTYGPQLDIPLASVEWVADLAERYEWRTDLGVAEPFGMKSHRYVWREPVGVVGAITPWNYPNQLNLAKIVPAIAAGNTIVLKPAPDTPWTGLVLGRILAEETDLPPGVVNIVTSSDHLLGQQLGEDPRVDMITFTGSTATGRKVMAAGATTVKKVFLELGGKSALIALDDADLAATAAGAAFAITSHAGQGCAITSRYLVPRARYEEALDAVVSVLGTIAYGDPTDPANLMGPLISERQRTRVMGYIEKGKQEGRLLTGGGVPAHLPRGYFVEPTIFADVDPQATVAQEEIFGPVLVVIPYEDDDDAVRVANSTIYGLSGSVSSASIDRARAVAARVRSGTLSVNGGVWFGSDVPFGGYKQSGVGREMGVPGFEEYLETKAVAEGA